MRTLATVVEGHGEVQALPVLLRRIAQAHRPGLVVDVPPPFRLDRGRLFDRRELGKAVQFVSRRIGGDGGGVLVLGDADDECPVDVASRAQEDLRALVDHPTAVVLANREYEAWFLASIVSLRRHRDMRDDAQPNPDPEAVRGAKEEMRDRMTVGRYSPTRHQPAFSELMDLDQAGTCRSFRKLYSAVESLLDA